MAVGNLTIRVSTKWWMRIYINTLIVLCQLTGAQPNMDRVDYWLRRGVTFKVVK